MSDHDIRCQNFLDLKYHFYNNERTARALKIIGNLKSGKVKKTTLHYLLRDHNEEEISDHETWKRDSFDYLLSYYSILEIACIAGYISRELPGEDKETALYILSNEAIKNYYEEFYPLLLPRLFLLRLEGKSELAERYADDRSGQNKLHNLFLRFLGIDQVIEDDHEVETFQWLLDGGERDGFDVDDLISAFKSANKTIEALSSPHEKRTTLHDAVNGAYKFFNFCSSLDSLMVDLKRYPVLQSAIWHYYAYWFSHFRVHIGGLIAKLTGSFGRWDMQCKPLIKSNITKEEINNFAENTNYTINKLLAKDNGLYLEYCSYSLRLKFMDSLYQSKVGANYEWAEDELAIQLPVVHWPIDDLKIFIAIEPKLNAERDKLDIALTKLTREDPLVGVRIDRESSKTIISFADERHMKMIIDRLYHEFNINANISEPQVAYRETIKQKAKQEGKYLHSTGGRGQFGHVWITVEPLGAGMGYKFNNKIIGNVIPPEFISAIDKGISEALEEGVIAGFPIIGVSVDLVDGSFHEVDSTELAFKIAGSMAFKEACKKANPVLLEPIMDLEVVVPDQHQGNVMGDLYSRRSKIMEIANRGNTCIIHADVPLSEMFGYSSYIDSITQGRAIYHMEFKKYHEVPREVRDTIIAKRSAKEKANA